MAYIESIAKDVSQIFGILVAKTGGNFGQPLVSIEIFFSEFQGVFGHLYTLFLVKVLLSDVVNRWFSFR